jgi:hypothetical protein
MSNIEYLNPDKLINKGVLKNKICVVRLPSSDFRLQTRLRVTL